MVCCSLCSKGKKTTAIDITDTYLDKRALREGVNFLQMDATALKFENESFDFVFSYDSFEHFSSPEALLQEAIRVTKKKRVYLFRVRPALLFTVWCSCCCSQGAYFASSFFKGCY